MSAPSASRTAAPPLHGSGGAIFALCLGIVTFQGVADARAGLPSDKTPEVNAISGPATHRALTERTADQVGLLLDKGASIDARNSQGATALMTAAGQGNLALLEVLINRGARIDAADHAGNTALHEASFHGEVSCVDALLRAGAPLSGRNGLGFTPLHQAVRRFWEISGESSQDRLAKQAAVIRLLLRYGADPLLKDRSGRTPAVLAVQSTNGILQQAFVPPPRLAPLQAMPSPSPESKPTPSDSALTSSTDRRPTPADNPVNPRQNEPVSASPFVASPADKSVMTSPPQETPSTSLSFPVPPMPSVTETGNDPQLAVPAPTPKGAGDQNSSAVPPPMEAVTPSRVPLPATELDSSQAPTSPAPIGDRPLPRPAQVASPSPSVDRHGRTGKEEPPQTVPTNPTAQTHASDADTRQPLAHPSPTDSATHTEMPAVTAPSTASSTADDVRHPDQSSAGLSHEPNSARSVARATTPSVPAPAQLSSAAATEPMKPVAESGPTIGGTSSPQDKTGELRTAGHRIPWLFHNVGLGLGLGWTHNLGPRRVDSVTVINGVVRIDNERNDLVRFMPEMHVWLDRWDEQRWSWGPFLAVAPGSRVIDAIGFGLMIGYRPHQADQYSFNLGIGGTLDLDTRVLGDGLVANEPLPTGETTARTKQTTAAGLLIMLSVGWDLTAPYKSAENEGR